MNFRKWSLRFVGIGAVAEGFKAPQALRGLGPLSTGEVSDK